MADVLCRVCGEAWDTHHLRFDAPAWVNDLVLAGTGCESCEGVSPEGVDSDQVAEESDRAFVIESPTDEDPLTVRPAIAGAAAPTWKRPPDELRWQCGHCEVSVWRNVDEREGHDRAFQVRGVSGYYNERKLGIEREDSFPSLSDALDEISVDGAHCRLCAYHCRDCSQVIVEGQDFSAAPPDDPYAANASVCEECFSALEYEQAEQSYSQRDLLSALGYSRQDLVYQWFDSHHGEVGFETARELELIEIEGDHVVYQVPNRYGREFSERPDQRKRRARILWAMREVVNVN
jgi:hypothetical protein